MPPVIPGPNSDVFPAGDQLFLAWAQNLAANVSFADPPEGSQPFPGVTLSDAVDNFADALLTATTPGERTTVTVQAKNDARSAVETLARQAVAYFRIQRRNGAISDSDLESMGIRPIRERTPIPAPDRAPIVSCTSMEPNQTRFAVRDPETPDRLALPYGVTGVEIEITTGVVSRLAGVFSRANVVIPSDPALVGNAASLRARYRTQRGLTGPWSASAPYIVT